MEYSKINGKSRKIAPMTKPNPKKEDENILDFNTSGFSKSK
jgi:hypothetical protein